jgi:hypothetical protein
MMLSCKREIALPGTIPPDNPDNLTLFPIKRDILRALKNS